MQYLRIGDLRQLLEDPTLEDEFVLAVDCGLTSDPDGHYGVAGIEQSPEIGFAIDETDDGQTCVSLGFVVTKDSE